MRTLVALEQILLDSVPTFILVWLLFLFINKVFLGPLGEVRKKRAAATDGLRQTAGSRLSLAEQKAAEHQSALLAGSSEIYREQEQERKRAVQKRMDDVHQARLRAEQLIAQARQELQREAGEAKQLLAQQSEQIALWITQAVIGRDTFNEGPSAKESR